MIYKRVLLAFFIAHGLLTLSPALGEEVDSPAARQMKQISRNFKALMSQISDPAQKDSSIKLVDAMCEAVNASRGLTPEPAQDLQGESLASYLKEYNQGLDELAASLQDLKKAIASGDSSAEQTLISTINTLKKTYHSDLR